MIKLMSYSGNGYIMAFISKTAFLNKKVSIFFRYLTVDVI